MKEVLVLTFILICLAPMISLSSSNESKIAQSHELSTHDHSDQIRGKHHHSHDRHKKSRYDLRHLDANQKGDGHKHDHKDGGKHVHKPRSKYDLRNVNGHDHGHAHHDRGDARHIHGDQHDSHGDHRHEEHGHDNGHGGHEHGYDRLWSIGVSS